MLYLQEETNKVLKEKVLNLAKILKKKVYRNIVTSFNCFKGEIFAHFAIVSSMTENFILKLFVLKLLLFQVHALTEINDF